MAAVDILTGTGDQISGTNLLLGPLADNGGLTRRDATLFVERKPGHRHRRIQHSTSRLPAWISGDLVFSALSMAALILALSSSALIPPVINRQPTNETVTVRQRLATILVSASSINATGLSMVQKLRRETGRQRAAFPGSLMIPDHQQRDDRDEMPNLHFVKRQQ